MKKSLIYFSVTAAVVLAVVIGSFIVSMQTARAEILLLPIRSVVVADGNAKGVASLYGNGDNYVTDIKVNVSFDGFAPYEIELDDGYSPFIETFDFGGTDKFLFCASQTGGSGGYGNYRVYALKTDSYKLLYDNAADSTLNTFGAEFLPDGFMRIEAMQSGLTIDVRYMDDIFFHKIFAPDGSLTGEQPYVNDVSFVSPSLDSASGVWRLVTYRSVVAVAEVNRIGYIVQTLDFAGDEFVPTFTEFSIRMQHPVIQPRI